MWALKIEVFNENRYLSHQLKVFIDIRNNIFNSDVMGINIQVYSETAKLKQNILATPNWL